MIDIVIPHYGDDALLNRCLDSIERNTHLEHRVIVVDNNAENRGFARACNAGIRQGDGEYVVLLNNDTEVSPGWLGSLVAIAEMDSRIAAVGPLSTAAGQWQWVHNVAKMLDVNLPINDYITSDVMQFPSQLAFWCALIPRRVLDEVGLLDEQFFMYCEDDDWCLRAQQAGYKLALDLGTVIRHDHRANYGGEITFSRNGRKETRSVRQIHAESFDKLRTKWDSQVVKPPSVYVAVLNQGHIRMELANSLVRWLRPRPDISNVALSWPFTKPIADNRNRITLDFLTDGGASKVLGQFKTGHVTPREALDNFLTDEWDYLWMNDDDVVPLRNPLNLIAEMQTRGIEILGLPAPIIQYSKRPEQPIFWNAFHYVSEAEPEPWHPLDLAGTNEFQEVDAVGTGAIIVHRSVLEHPDLQAPFARMFDEFGVAVRGLDLWFCEKAKRAGFRVWTHTGYPCEHYWEVPLARVAGLIRDVKEQGHVDKVQESSDQEALVRMDA